MIRIAIARRVNRRWPTIAYIILIGLKPYLVGLNALEEGPEPEPWQSPGKPGSI